MLLHQISRPSSSIFNRTARRATGTIPRLAYALEKDLLAEFKSTYFDPELPCLFPRNHFGKIPAIKDWFNRDENGRTTMNESFFESASAAAVLSSATTASVKDPIVELEVVNGQSTEFSKLSVPLSAFLRILNLPLPPLPTPPPSDSSTSDGTTPNDDGTTPKTEATKAKDLIPSLYLAQQSTPAFLAPSLPTPSIVKLAGKGDIYGHALWLGTTPTNTPLHRDPNGNLFVQLKSRKVIRMTAPAIGKGLVELAMQAGGNKKEVGNLQGEEMMTGRTKELLDLVVFGNPFGKEKARLETEQDEWEKWEALREGMLECVVEPGDGVWIPKGWYHAVKGVAASGREDDREISASVNWWFR